MNDIDLLAFALAEEVLRRKRLELENMELKKRLIALEPKKETEDGKAQ